MATKGFNTKSPTIRRILREAQELANAPSPDFHASPSDSDLFSWHFTIRGPPSSPYANGIYHGRIVLPSTYPLRPPSFRFLTPTGRFEVNREICLSISGHHEETWMPAWGVRTAMLALRSFMEQPSEGQVGGMDLDDDLRRKLADQSRKWKCEECGKTNEDILRESAEEAEKLAGDKKVEDDKVPEELKMGYREDIERQPIRGGGEDDPEAEERQARAEEAQARAEMTQNRRTSDAPTREDSEEIARIANMFDPVSRPSPIPRMHQSPNQLEPIVGSPPPNLIYPPAQPGQTAPAPTGTATAHSRTSSTSSRVSSSYAADAFPPYLDHPQPRRPSTTPGIPGPAIPHPAVAGTPSTADHPPNCSCGGPHPDSLPEDFNYYQHNANLPPETVRRHAEAASRMIESVGADLALRNRRVLPREQGDVMATPGERNRAMAVNGVNGAAAVPRGPDEIVWIDRLVKFLVGLLAVVVVRFVYLMLKPEMKRMGL